MMPRIEAGEALAAYNRAALSHNVGFEKELDRQQALDELRRKAIGAPPPEPLKASPGDLAAMGIGFSGGEGELPTIGNLEEWLGNPSSSEAVGEQGRG